MLTALVLGLSLLVASGGVADAQTMVPAKNASCPSGSSYAGAGYCWVR